jgi:hypothetical protein
MINVEKLSTALIHQTRETGLAILQSRLKVGSRLIASKHPVQDPRKGWSDLNVWRRKTNVGGKQLQSGPKAVSATFQFPSMDLVKELGKRMFLQKPSPL